MAVGGGDNQRVLLKARVGKGNPPDAAQVNTDVRAYASDRSNLANLDDLAAREKWDSVLPEPVRRYVKVGGNSYVMVPVNVNRQNLMWISTASLKKIGADAPPRTWDEFFAMADKARAAGMIPLAMAEDHWVFSYFYQVAYSTLGPEGFRKALNDGEEAAIRSPGMLEAFKILRKSRAYVDRGASTRKWNAATQMVMQGKAFAQVMGEWAKGEFARAGKKPNQDYVCAPVPGTADGYVFSSDAFVFFKHDENVPAQLALAQVMMDKEAQQAFNLLKGSVPVRTDADVSKFDECGKRSYADFVASGNSGTLAAAPNMVASPGRFAAWRDAVLAYWNDDAMTVQQGVDKLVAATKAN
jgi:glucose/mannose transport system substrate-binding protein